MRDHLVNDEQEDLFGWLAPRIQLTHSADFRAVGRIVNGQIVGVFGFNNHNGASCQIHTAGDGRWLNRALLWKTFQVPFIEWGYQVLLAPIGAGNAESLRLAAHLGFAPCASIPGAHLDGALEILAMRRSACRWLNLRYRDSHG